MTVSRVTRLTPEQKARTPEWNAKWIAKGLSCEEADWATFEVAAQKCYAYAGLAPFKRLVKVQSPRTLVLAAPIADSLLGTKAAKASNWQTVVASVLPNEEDLRRDVLAAVTEALGDHRPGPVTAKTLKTAISTRWGHWLGGCWWLSWQAHTSFFRDVVGLELPGDLWDRDRAYAAAQESVGWWWLHTEFVMASNRPTEIHTLRVRPDGWGSHVLHNPNGPAIAWRDGWELYVWRGIPVPKQVIVAPETLTREQVVGETNAEVRRAMIEKLGPERFVSMLGAAPVARDDYGDLYRIPRPDDSDLVLVKLRNSTPEPDGSVKDYFLRAHFELRPMREDGSLGEPQEDSALNAVASTFGMRGREYLLAQET